MTLHRVQAVAASCLLLLARAPHASAATFVRGDVDASGGPLQITDAVRTFGYLFLGNPTDLPCHDAADSDDSGVINITDGIYTLSFLFLGGPAPPPPFDGCGGDPSSDPLDCAAFPGCEPIERSFPAPDDGPGGQEPALDEHDGPAASVYPPGSSVALNTGEMRLVRIDLVIPGRGQVDFVLERCYRSRLAHDGPLGHGWDFTHDEALLEEPSGDVLRSNGRGRVDRWKREAGGTYLPPPGHFGLLRKEADGTFELRAPDGFRRLYDASGLLVAHADRNGNRMTFERRADGRLLRVLDPYLRSVEFIFEEQPDGRVRLARVRDYTGREVRYAYDARGDLVSATTPGVTGTSTGNDFPEGRTERYRYASGTGNGRLEHNLLGVTAPEESATGGPEYLACAYGEDIEAPATFDRLISLSLGGTNASGAVAGGTIRYGHEILNPDVPAGDPQLVRRRVVVDERNGNRFECYFNELRHQILHRRRTRGLRPGEPAAYETRSEYDADGLLLRRVFPEGNEVRFEYDTLGPRAAGRNLLEVRRVPDAARGGGDDLVTTATWEPLFQRLASITDPRGNAPGFQPPLGTASADRYTTRFLYDYQEGSGPVEEAERLGIDLSGIARGLGDLNGDGTTGQSAGNLVRRTDPTVTLLPDGNEAARLGSTQQSVVTEYRWNERGQLSAVVDAEGNLTLYDRYPEDDPDGDGSPVPGAGSSEEAGYVRTITVDAAPAPARRTAAAPPAALVSRYAWDAAGNLARFTDPRGVETHIEHNQLDEPVVLVRGAETAAAVAAGQLPTGEAPLRYTTRYHYDRNGRRVKVEVENRDGITPGVGDWVEQTRTFDILDDVVEIRAEVDAGPPAVWRIRYDANELPVSRIAPEGNEHAIEYDERGLPFRATRGHGSPDASTVQADYDRNGNLVRLTDAEDHDGDGQPEAASWSYDGFDRRVRAVDRAGNEVVRGYDPASGLVSEVSLGKATGIAGEPNVRLRERRVSRDELGRAFRVEAPLFLAEGVATVRPPDLRDHDGDGIVATRLEHDALSRPTFLVEDDGDAWRTAYDGAGRPVEGSDPEGNVWRVLYDAGSNPIEMRRIEVSPEGIVPPEEFVVHLVWDQLGRLVRQSAGQAVRFTYDSRDLLIEWSDAEGPVGPDPLGIDPRPINGPGNTTRLRYDGRGLVTAVVRDLRVGGVGGGPIDGSNPHDPDGAVTLLYEHDRNGRLTAMVDDAGNRTRLEYDALDRPFRRTFADGTQHAWLHDRDGDIVLFTDARGTSTRSTHDALGRLIERRVEPAPGVEGTTLATYSWDGLSRCTRAVDDGGPSAPSHAVERAYDSLSRLLEERQDGEALSSSWSGDGRRAALTYPGGRALRFERDRSGRLDRILEGAEVIADHDWIGPGSGRLLQRLHANGTVLSFLGDGAAGAIGWDLQRRAGVLSHRRQDGSRFVTQVNGYNRADQRVFEERLDLGGQRDTFRYDSLYRLIEAAYGSGGPLAAARDLLGSLFTYDGAGNRRERSDTTASSGPSIESYAVNSVHEYTQIGTTARQHDADGNVTSDGVLRYAYDYRDRLVGVSRATDGAPIASYEYDALGRRVRKSVRDPAAPGAPPVVTRYLYDGWRSVEEQTDAGATQATYVHGVGLDDLIEMRTTAESPAGARRLVYHPTARGDVAALTDESGAVVERVVYDAFGNADRAGDSGNPHLFQGHRRDPETGLYYLRNRYYDPRTGRFLQRDRIHDPVNAGNPYTFAGNGPVSRGDPLGLDTEPVDALIAGLDVTMGVLDVASEPINIIRDVSKSVSDATGVPLWIISPFTWMTDGTVFDQRNGSEFHSMMAKGMEDRYVRRGWSAPATIGATMVEGGLSAYPPTAIAMAGYGAVEAVAEGDARGVGRAGAGLALAGWGAREHYQSTGSVFGLPVRVAPAPRPLPADVDPVALDLLNEMDLTPDTPLYRVTDRQFLDVAPDGRGGTARGNPGSMAEVMDIYNTDIYGRHPNINADTLGPTLNVAVESPTGNYGAAGQVEIAITVGDVLAQGGRFYPDVGALALGVRPLIVTLPQGAVPFQFVPVRPFSPPPGISPLVPFFWTPYAPPEEPDATADVFRVAPGLGSVLNVSLNDGGPAGGSYVLVGPPPLHADIFEWRGNGTFRIQPLMGEGSQVQFTYRREVDGKPSEVRTVTVQLDLSLLTNLPIELDGAGNEIVRVPALKLDAEHYPVHQFLLRNSPNDVCKEPHWHAHFPVYSLEQPDIGVSDPAASNCGFGRVKEVPLVAFPIPRAAWESFLANHP